MSIQHVNCMQITFSPPHHISLSNSRSCLVYHLLNPHMVVGCLKSAAHPFCSLIGTCVINRLDCDEEADDASASAVDSSDDESNDSDGAGPGPTASLHSPAQAPPQTPQSGNSQSSSQVQSPLGQASLDNHGKGSTYKLRDSRWQKTKDRLLSWELFIHLVIKKSSFVLI